jgi:hypothetical protein
MADWDQIALPVQREWLGTAAAYHLASWPVPLTRGHANMTMLHADTLDARVLPAQRGL